MTQKHLNQFISFCRKTCKDYRELKVILSDLTRAEEDFIFLIKEREKEILRDFNKWAENNTKY